MRDAAIDAATLSLRPILSTMLSTVLGAVPLVQQIGRKIERGLRRVLTSNPT